MNVLVKTGEISREEWLRLRTKGIGGSDVSVIAGVNPYRSIFHLWKEKTGQIQPEETESEYTHFGTVLESVIRREFIERTGLKVRRKNAILQSGEYPWMLADLDGVIYENGKLCIFEAKTASAYKQEVWEQGVPLEYLYQIQHYMAVTEAEKTYIAALVGGNRFIWHEVYRDEEMVKEIIQMEESFWKTNVLGGIEPVADGSEATTKYLDGYFSDSDGSVIELPEKALAVCEEYERLSRQVKELEKAKNASANQLKNYLKEAEKGVIGDHQVIWKQVSRSGVDTARLREEKPDIYKDYVTQICYRRLLVA